MRQSLPELIAALSFFGAIVICPLVYMLMRHQRTIAELMHRSPENEVLQRLQVLEHELQELKAARNEQVLRDDDRRALGDKL